MSRVDPPPSSGAARKDPDILVRGVYETGVVEWRFSRSLLSSKSKWFAAACHPNAFRVSDIYATNCGQRKQHSDIC